ncbi:hypothetical protein PGTUg99_012973 [Puccinia graminis f. sp. tritici]|uniref:Uncharacterized protein n=1 Tax=Puccinia graminis f. sp. tritici TaxID=56615 RepID=A0A5B0RZ07_PUCGR|nr:hypothetical protein PGTUg99_012973 [Puccinia graminis f. sp. tritici]
MLVMSKPEKPKEGSIDKDLEEHGLEPISSQPHPRLGWLTERDRPPTRLDSIDGHPIDKCPCHHIEQSSAETGTAMVRRTPDPMDPNQRLLSLRSKPPKSTDQFSPSYWLGSRRDQ